jgi:hypothetical protein
VIPDAPQQLIERVRGEYLEMPGMRLTESQAQRLYGIDSATCRAVLQALVDLRFLRANEDGTYARHSAVRRPLKASLQTRLSRFAS